jgi:hypothetical protein
LRRRQACHIALRTGVPCSTSDGSLEPDPQSRERQSEATHHQLPQGPQLVGFVADEGNDHTVEVEEEHEQVETELDE